MYSKKLKHVFFIQVFMSFRLVLFFLRKKNMSKYTYSIFKFVKVSVFKNREQKTATL